MALNTDQAVSLIGKQQMQIEEMYLVIKHLKAENEQLKAKDEQPEKAEDGDAKE